MFIYGMWLFALASLAGGLAQSDIWLIVARAIQGLGAALISPAALAIVTTTFREGAERNRALGVWGAVAGSGGAAGVLLGGVLTESLGWEWVLFVNTPIGIAAALLAPRLLGESLDRSRASFDVAGAVSSRPAGTARLHPRRCQRRRLGLDADARAGAVSVALLALFVGSSRAPATRWCPSRSSGAYAARRERRGAAARDVLFLDVLLHLAVHAAGARLRAAQGRAGLPAARAARSSSAARSALVTRIELKPTLIAGMLFIAGGLVWFAQVSAPAAAMSATSCSRRCWRQSTSDWRSSRRRSAAAGDKPDEAGLRRASSTRPSRSAARSAWRSWRRSRPPPRTTRSPRARATGWSR